MNLQNDIALVTGATRGIGKGIALALGHAGATVIGTATSQEGADSITAALNDQGIQGRGLVLNVTDAEAVKACLETIKTEYGVPSILVNNAGITRDNVFLRMSEAEWDDIISTNLSSLYRLSKACVRGMLKAKRGRIINISSVVGAMGNAGQANYAAAKAGAEGFTRALARELGSRNITVNAIAPGFIDTDMTKNLPEDQKTSLVSSIPLGRLGSVDDIANAVVFLSSDSGAYITGHTLHVNGGMYMN